MIDSVTRVSILSYTSTDADAATTLTTKLTNQPLSIHCMRWPPHYFFPLHAGLSLPFHAGAVRVGKGTISQYYIIYAYVPLNLSILTLHRPHTFSLLFPHILLVSPPVGAFQNKFFVCLTARSQCNQVSLMQPGSTRLL